MSTHKQNVHSWAIRTLLIRRPQQFKMKFHKVSTASLFRTVSSIWSISSRSMSCSPSYVQGQEPENGVREYFYYIDHQGMVICFKIIIFVPKQLYLDDSKMKNFTSCFKEKKFLTFFFRRIKKNNTGRYEEHFPFWSDCGKERNYIRGDDYPIVYTHIAKKVPRGGTELEEHLCYGHVGDVLSFKFQPEKIFMADTGRVYHPALTQAGSVGLISSKLAIELSKNFVFDKETSNSPSHINWNGVVYALDNTWFHAVSKT